VPTKCFSIQLELRTFGSRKGERRFISKFDEKNINEMSASSNSSKFFWRQYFLAYGNSHVETLCVC